MLRPVIVPGPVKRAAHRWLLLLLIGQTRAISQTRARFDWHGRDLANQVSPGGSMSMFAGTTDKRRRLVGRCRQPIFVL